MRVILHVDMDAFFAAVEQRDRPELRGKPVIVGAPPDRRGVVAAASYEARRFGVHSAMPSCVAGRLCPQGVFLPVDMRRYAAVSQQVFAIFERFTPLVEALSLDEAFLDVTGAQKMFGDGRTIGEKIRAAVAGELGLTASVGVAHNKFLAKLGSELCKPDGLLAVPSDPAAVAAWLRPLPVERIFGVGRATGAQLARIGAKTVGDLQDLPLARLENVLGKSIARDIKALAAGEDDRPVMPEESRKSIGREHTFEKDCADQEIVRRMLLLLCEDVGRRLRADNLRAQGVRLKLRLPDFTTLTRQQVLATPFCDDVTLRRAALRIFEVLPKAPAIRLIGVAAFGLTASGGCDEAVLAIDTSAEQARWEALSRTVDAIRNRFGARSICAGGALDDVSAARRRK